MKRMSDTNFLLHLFKGSHIWEAALLDIDNMKFVDKLIGNDISCLIFNYKDRYTIIVWLNDFHCSIFYGNDCLATNSKDKNCIKLGMKLAEKYILA